MATAVPTQSPRLPRPLTSQDIAFFRAQQPAAPAAAAAPKAPPPLGLPAAYGGAFDQASSAANETYKSGLAQNTQAQGLLRNQYVQQFRDLAQKYGLARTQEPYTFNGRGMLDSGVYHQALQDLAQQNLRNYGGLQAAENAGLGNLDIARQQLESQRVSAIAQINAQRQAAIASLGTGSIK